MSGAKGKLRAGLEALPPTCPTQSGISGVHGSVPALSMDSTSFSSSSHPAMDREADDGEGPEPPPAVEEMDKGTWEEGERGQPVRVCWNWPGAGSPPGRDQIPVWSSQGEMSKKRQGEEQRRGAC